MLICITLPKCFWKPRNCEGKHFKFGMQQGGKKLHRKWNYLFPKPNNGCKNEYMQPEGTSKGTLFQRGKANTANLVEEDRDLVQKAYL